MTVNLYEKLFVKYDSEARSYGPDETNRNIWNFIRQEFLQLGPEELLPFLLLAHQLLGH